MKYLQAVELKNETSDFYLKEPLNSKSHIRKIAAFKHRNFPLI